MRNEEELVETENINLDVQFIVSYQEIFSADIHAHLKCIYRSNRGDVSIPESNDTTHQDSTFKINEISGC